MALSRVTIIALLLGGADVAEAQQLALKGMVTPLAAGYLGGITAIVRYTVARPDRGGIAYTFVTGSLASSEPPREVQVRGSHGEQLHLTAQEGADCTLSAVQVLTTPSGRGVVISAVRRFSPILAENDYSAPAPMEVQIYRPVQGGDPGESPIILRATGAPVVTAALCDGTQVRRAMLAVARSVR